MKRVGNLYPKICELNNLYEAFYKASKGKQQKADVLSFRNNLSNNLSYLRNSLIDENVSIGNYSYFTITDPKERIICAAAFSERVIHHAIINIPD